MKMKWVQFIDMRNFLKETLRPPLKETFLRKLYGHCLKKLSQRNFLVKLYGRRLKKLSKGNFLKETFGDSLFWKGISCYDIIISEIKETFLKKLLGIPCFGREFPVMTS